MLQQFLQDSAFWIWWLPGQHVEERAAERVDIAAHIGGAWVTCLFGRDVVESAECDIALSESAVVTAFEATGKAHIDQLGSPWQRDDNIRWLDVTVHDAA